jgi:hypothetical protein
MIMEGTPSYSYNEHLWERDYIEHIYQGVGILDVILEVCLLQYDYPPFTDRKTSLGVDHIAFKHGTDLIPSLSSH